MVSLESFVGAGRVFLVEVQHLCQSGVGLRRRDYVQELWAGSAVGQKDGHGPIIKGSDWQRDDLESGIMGQKWCLNQKVSAGEDG